MIEARQDGPYGVFRVYVDDEPLCTVTTICEPWRDPDWKATRKRAEHIANALRHYQASQEGERVP